MEQTGFVAYLLLKYLAYSVWCWVDLKKQKGGRRGLWVPAVGWGFLRLAMGFFFGIGIYLLSTSVACALPSELPAREVFTYLFTYVPVRWIEWAIMDVLISSRRESLKSFLLGSDAFSRKWRLGGIVLSCLADGPMMAMMGGFPIGRFMC